MKILYISNGFPPQRWAGTETYTAGIANGMQKTGHTVHVLCCGNWDDGPAYWNGFKEDVYNEIQVRRLDVNWQKAPDPNRYLYDNPYMSEYLDHYLEEIKPDLVHITSCETLSAGVLGTVKRNHLPLVLSLTDFWFLCPRINLLHGDGSNCNGITKAWDCLRCLMIDQKAYQIQKRILPDPVIERLLTTVNRYPFVTRHRGLRGLALNINERKGYLRRMFALADIRLTASQFVKDTHSRNGFNDPILVHSYGHDMGWLEKYHGKQPSTRLRIGFIGQIINSKGVHVLLEAAIQLHKSLGDKLSFMIYGNLQKEPEYGKKLQMMAEEVDNVEFCGTYKREDSAKVYSSFDILTVPSLWYDFPLVIYEAFATQTPVIATNLGGMAEAVKHEVNGLLFERGNAFDLAQQIQRFTEEPDLYAHLVSGIPKVKRIEEEVQELEQIYSSLLK